MGAGRCGGVEVRPSRIFSGPFACLCIGLTSTPPHLPAPIFLPEYGPDLQCLSSPDAGQAEPELSGVVEAGPEAVVGQNLAHGFSDHPHDPHNRQDQQQAYRSGYGGAEEEHDHTQNGVNVQAAANRQRQEHKVVQEADAQE